MIKIVTLTTLLIPVFLFLPLKDSAAQYQISGASFSGGGGVTTGGDYTVSATIGQPAVGIATGENYQVQNGFWNFYESDIATSLEEQKEMLPEEFSLDQNYPNPFNPATTIAFSLPEESDVRLVIYDMLGRQVATLVDETKSAGSYDVTFNAGNLASGTYIYRLQAGDNLKTRTMTLVK